MKPFFAQILPSLTPIDDRGEDWLHEIIKAARAGDCHDLADFLTHDTQARTFLAPLCTLSPYLRETLINQPHFLDILRRACVDEALTSLIAKVHRSDEEQNLTEAALMRRLRQLKKQAALFIALGDLGHCFDVALTTHFLSLLAEAALRAALRFLLRQAHGNGHIKLTDLQNPEKDCGFVLLGLGKLGSHELNYSSDIDLIAFIDEQAAAITNIQASVDVFSKLMRRLTRIMQERTEDGYVFRIDLRLRPDPTSTPLALPFGAALHYYESRGQNWERAAFIKARPVAGDIEAGERFLKELEPYIWRKYLDYATLADIAAIKDQIHQTRPGLTNTALRGANVKLGVGGIREIEFFVQTQQLIAGGRLPQLRGRATVAMLSTLTDLGWITQQACDELSKNYAFLRRVEHAIQMVADEQSHTLPQDEQGFCTIAYLMGYSESQIFATDLTQVMRQVESHYSALFADMVPKNSQEHRLNFTTEEANPHEIDTLSRLGFSRIHDMYRIIHGWHVGGYRATHSTQARTRLRQLLPSLLPAIAASGRADETLLQFDAFLRALPAGVQLFSLLQSNKGLLDMLMLVLGAAPRLADIITRKPHVFDGMLEPTLYSSLPTLALLKQRLELFLEPARHYEERLDRLRIFRQEQHFLIGLRLLVGSINASQAGQAFSLLADLMIEKALAFVCQEFIRHHGQIKGGRIAILGLGKLGSRELRAGSDVDLILLYQHDEAFDVSDGAKPLHVAQYYTRLTQRLISALVSPTAEGVLYQVDMRLRPSGNKGPVAVPFDAFRRYQRGEAWVWEHLALTRAQPIAGDGDLCAKIAADIGDILAKPRPDEAIIKEISAMRTRISAEKPAKNIWDLKHIEGGIIELEFIAQYGVLSRRVPYQNGQTSGEILAALPQDFCPADEQQKLTEAFNLYTELSQISSLCLDASQDLGDAPAALLEKILTITQQPDKSRLEDLIRERAAHVHAVFKRLFLAGAAA